MPSLRDMRARIVSVKNTQQITRAMKMVSAAKLRRAQEAVVNMRPYAQKTLQVIANVAVTQRVEHGLLQVPTGQTKSILMVVLTSDRGLCGGFNNAVCRFTERFLATERSKFEKVDFIFIGKKGSDYFRRRGITPRQTMLNLAREISYHMATEMAQTCMQEFMSGDYDEVRFIYNEFKSAISQKLVVETILPIDITKSAFNEDASHKFPFARDMIFEPAPEDMVEQLLAQHFAVQVFRCMAESVAAEHAARMTSMENATKNAKEMIEKLTLTYNKLRQASITRELIEICSGAEALQ